MAVFFCLMQFKPIYNYQIFFKGSPRTINSNLRAPSEIHIMFQNMLEVEATKVVSIYNNVSVCLCVNSLSIY